MSNEGLNALRPRIINTAFHVVDLDRSSDFYVSVLGMRELMRFPLPSGEIESVLAFPDSKGSGVILISHPSRAEPYVHGDGYSRLVLKISDLDAAVSQLRHRGVNFTKPPTAGPNGMRYAMFADPDGYIIELLQLPKP
jgi:lactoylglutathione lyase